MEPEYCDKCMQVSHKCHVKEGARPPIPTRRVSKWIHKNDTSKKGEAEIQGDQETAVIPQEEAWKVVSPKIATKATPKEQPGETVLIRNGFDTLNIYEHGSTSVGDDRFMHKKGEGDGLTNNPYDASHLEH